MSSHLVDSLNIDYGENFAMIGATESYDLYHQQGTYKMPTRPFLGLGDDGVEEIRAILNNALRNAVSD